MSYSDYDSEDGDSNLEFSEDEYNSEDDEFLAFHDADIEAQVRAEIEKMKRRREEAEMFNTELVLAADQDKISAAISQQIKLLGSTRLYERINNNFKIAKFEAHFAKVKLQAPVDFKRKIGLYFNSLGYHSKRVLTKVRF